MYTFKGELEGIGSRLFKTPNFVCGSEVLQEALIKRKQNAVNIINLGQEDESVAIFSKMVFSLTTRCTNCALRRPVFSKSTPSGIIKNVNIKTLYKVFVTEHYIALILI